MRLGLLRPLVAVLVAAALAGCASKRPLPDKPILHTIALIPATEPREMTLLNQTVMIFLSPIVETGIMLNSKSKAKVFTEAMQSRHLELASRLTTKVVDGLRSAGYRVEVLDHLARPAADPDDIDYDKLGTAAEVIVQLRVNEVGLFSSRNSNDYLPRVNIDGKLYIRAFDDAPYDETLYFGVDAQEGKTRHIVADPKFAYPTFDAVTANYDQIGALFQDATDQIATVMIVGLLETLAANTLRP
jgi:hypothetical protein